MPADHAGYVLTREQVEALARSSSNDTNQAHLLREILGPCGSIWNDLRCDKHEGHKGSHVSKYDGSAWAAWETHAAHEEGDPHG